MRHFLFKPFSTITTAEILDSARSPLLSQINRYYADGGKQIRPHLITLLSKCITGFEPLPSQLKLAQIVELIHSASLLHDDVIDEATVRRSKPSANTRFSNKMAVLSGDYLLAQASVELSKLGNLKVIELLATVIKDLVEGEFMQMEGKAVGGHREAFERYIEKSYLKTASLLSKSFQATAQLANAPEPVGTACYQFGKSVGLAFQVVDDMLDYTGTEVELGKPCGWDLRSGLLTAPALFAAQSSTEFREMISRRFSKEGDYERAIQIIRLETTSLEKTQELANGFLEKAIDSLSIFENSKDRKSLESLAVSLIYRRK